MNTLFSNLSPQKRSQILAIIIGVVAVTGILYFTLWSAQTTKLKRLRDELAKTESQADTIRKTLSKGTVIAAQLEAATNKLAELESSMATGDLYLWLFQTLKTFQARHRNVDIVLGQTTSGEMSMFPKFPYSQVKIGLGGTAYFHDLGKFIADFENSFPLMRIENLSIIQLAGAKSVEDREKINFRFEVVSLVKP